MRAWFVTAWGRPRARWTLIAGAGAVVVVSIGVLVFEVLPDLFAPGPARGFGVAEEAKARTDVRTSALQLLGGIVIAIGAVLTARNVQLTRERNRIEREGQITERFTRAIDQLGSGKLDIRLGGIYALERIARDSTDDHWTIMEVLTAFAREHAPRKPRAEVRPDSPPPHKPATDVQAVLRVLGRRDTSHDDGRRLDLEAVDMEGAQLAKARFGDAQLRDARLDRARLHRADLSATTLWGSQLEAADLTRANLERAFAYEANLRHASLRGATLSGASLMSADLSHARLMGADLRGVSLEHAKLDGTLLRGAEYDTSTRWPTGVDPVARGAKLVVD